MALPLCSSLNTYDLLLRVVQDFRPLYCAQATPRGLRRAVGRQSGSLLNVGSPAGWQVTLLNRAEVSDLRNVDLKKYCPTPQEWLVPVGPLTRNQPPCISASETRAHLVIGAKFRVYVFDAVEGCLHLAARDFEEFAHCGLGAVRCLYLPHCMPRAPSEPRDLIAALEVCTDPESMSDICRENNGSYLHITDPTGNSHQVKLCGTLENALRLWPFSSAEPRTRDAVVLSITQRLCCPWRPLGLVGSSAGEPDRFRSTLMLLVDQFAAVFGYCFMNGSLFRLADSFHELTRCGLLRALTGTRWCYGPEERYAGARLLEQDPDVRFWLSTRPGYEEMLASSTKPGDYEAHLMCITRPDRVRQVQKSGQRCASPTMADAIAANDYTWREPTRRAFGDAYTDPDTRDYASDPLPGNRREVFATREEKYKNRDGRPLNVPVLFRQTPRRVPSLTAGRYRAPTPLPSPPPTPVCFTSSGSSSSSQCSPLPPEFIPPPPPPPSFCVNCGPAQRRETEERNKEEAPRDEGESATRPRQRPQPQPPRSSSSSSMTLSPPKPMPRSLPAAGSEEVFGESGSPPPDPQSNIRQRRLCGVRVSNQRVAQPVLAASFSNGRQPPPPPSRSIGGAAPSQTVASAGSPHRNAKNGEKASESAKKSVQGILRLPNASSCVP